jgi:hypothetical protein
MQAACYAIPSDTVGHLALSRGAISDFHAFKAKILEADYDQICFRINEDDIFGDGNNFQVGKATPLQSSLDSLLDRKQQMNAADQCRLQHLCTRMQR